MGIANFKMFNSVRGRSITPGCLCGDVDRFSHHRRNDDEIRVRSGLN